MSLALGSATNVNQAELNNWQLITFYGEHVQLFESNDSSNNQNNHFPLGLDVELLVVHVS